jgi:hypothetical protein
MEEAFLFKSAITENTNPASEKGGVFVFKPRKEKKLWQAITTKTR